jgi:hypothetical protein
MAGVMIKMNPEKLTPFIFTRIALTLLCYGIIWLSGCQRAGEPHMRLGAFFGSPGGMQFPEPNNLGIHSFEFNVNEKTGMLYTCKGGFIDLGHLREAADRTEYLTETVYKNLISKKTNFSLFVIEPSRYWVRVSYPSDWDNYSPQQKETVAGDVSILLGRYLAHTSLIWHEIITGYGFASGGIFPETISSFSCEDPYSDLLGTCLGAEALHNKQLVYDDAMTKLIEQTLKDLDAQPARVAFHAAKSVEGQWYTGGFYFFVTMKKRSYDIGQDNGYITPVLVPGICPDAEAQSFPVPGLEEIEQYGFKAIVEIEPRILENDRICDSIHLDRSARINPQIHFKLIVEYLEYTQNELRKQQVTHRQ